VTLRLLTIAIALLLAACGGEPQPSDAPTPEPGNESMDVIEPLAGPAREARRDLARRTGVDERAIRVVTAEFVTWPDSALGCPEPGSAYLQALTPGYRIRLETPDGIHHYHGAEGKPPFYCPAERASAPAETGRHRDPRV
jgi:hypothetical protein